MNVLRKSVVSCGTDSIAVMQLSRSDEMGRVERGVPSSRPGHQSCSLYASTPLSCRRCTGAVERRQRVCRSSGLTSARSLALRTARAALFNFVLFVTCRQILPTKRNTRYSDCQSCECDVELVESVITTMKCGKAAGFDGVTVEHLQYSHPLLPLAKLFDVIMLWGGAVA